MSKGDSKNIKFSIKVKVSPGYNSPSTRDMPLSAISGTVIPFISNQFKKLVNQKFKQENCKYFAAHSQTFLCFSFIAIRDL